MGAAALNMMRLSYCQIPSTYEAFIETCAVTKKLVPEETIADVGGK